MKFKAFLSLSMSEGEIVFTNGPYDKRIYFGAPIGESVVDVDACDLQQQQQQPQGPCIRSSISFVLVGANSSSFTIDAGTGEIATAVAVTQNIGTVFYFSAVAYSSGYSNDASITVTVSANNRYAPVFYRLNPIAFVYRALIAGSHVLTVHTTDADDDDYNRNTTFRLIMTTTISDVTPFVIDPTSGEITVNPIGSESVVASVFNVTITANNLDASPSRVTSASIAIRLSNFSGYIKQCSLHRQKKVMRVSQP